MAYSDLASIHVPATGTVAPAAWGLQIRDNFEFLIDPPSCSVFASVFQTVATGSSFTILTADSENFDNDGMHSTVSNTSRITIQTAGRYRFQAVVSFDANTSGGLRGFRFVVNGTAQTNTGASLPPVSSGGFATVINASYPFTLVAGDYVEVEARQNSGGNLGILLADFSAKFDTR